MLYSYKCSSCKAQEYFSHGMNDRPTFNCKECGAIMSKELCTNFIKKGFGWPSQDILEKKSRLNRSNELKRKQKETGLSIYDRVPDGRKIKSEKERKQKIESGGLKTKIFI
jgi:predicted nucleic acid-binding Zn ribbon protein